MTLSIDQLDSDLLYPDSDGKPMAESDPTRDYLIYGVEALGNYFQDRPDVYVSGNLFIYYKQGVPDAVIAPDVFVVFGVEKKKRRSYKVWEEGGKTPAFVLEITSKTTQEQDEEDKPQKYARLGVLEYFQYDPTGEYLQPQLKGLRLVEGHYHPIPANLLPDGSLSIYSEVLGLELRLTQGELRFYTQTGQKLLSPSEAEQARRETEQALQQTEQALQQTEQALQQTEQALQQETQLRRAAVPRLLAMGLSFEQVAAALNLSVEAVRQIAQQQGWSDTHGL
ncbi:MAG: Uma2 family endonuclease [Leptolyngbya sp. IPPAS B-1204]|nr:MAG: Uma2 family endonuclease [Leptolyngbya sp. IPPAS B-1204]